MYVCVCVCLERGVRSDKWYLEWIFTCRNSRVLLRTLRFPSFVLRAESSRVRNEKFARLRPCSFEHRARGMVKSIRDSGLSECDLRGLRHMKFDKQEIISQSSTIGD